jgi:hypothetical protein
MKTILEHIKLISAVVLGVIAVVALGWKGYAFIETYVDDQTFEKQCLTWKGELEVLKAADAELEEAIAGLSRQQMINSIRQNLNYYKRMIDEYHRKFGQNCANCDQFNKDTYWHYRREYDRLVSELRRLGG